MHGYFALQSVIHFSLGLLYTFMVIPCGFGFVFSVLVKRLAEKNISWMSHLVSSGM